MQDVIRQKIIDSLATPPPALTTRDVRLPKVPRKAVAVIGMRRAGKTTYLWQVVAERLAARTPREGLLYFSFEDERLTGMKAADLHLVVEEYYRLHPDWREKRRAVFLFDEIQNVSGWEGFARRLLDTEQVELFLSGSSAKLLSREVATSMRGRALEAVMYPFSFREMLRHTGREPKQPVDRLPKAARSVVQHALHEYLTWGGFPEAQGIEQRDRFELLRSYVDLALLRDVIERHAVSNPVALRWMSRHLLANAGGSFSISKFHGDLRSQGIPVAKDTLHEYLAHLEDAFLIRTVSVAGGSERRRMVNPRKVYPIDPGLIPVYDQSGRANVGHALETCVYLELARRGAEVTYIRTASGQEVDFLARYHDGREELIQVCADLTADDTCEREVQALVQAAKEHRRAELHIITLAPPTGTELPAKVKLQDVAVWLLGTSGVD
jgi:predicted AAA+ superfamily ATPase